MEQDIDKAFAELGLSPGASEIEVKTAWRRLVSRWHPDRNASAAAVTKMQRVNRAVEAIRQAGVLRPAPAGGARATPPDAPPEAPPDTPEATPQAPPAAAADGAAKAAGRAIQRKLRLTLEEAAFGCTKVLRGKISATCPDCAGVGWRALGGHCRECQGSGATRPRSWFGWAAAPQTECSACQGGGIARQPCSACGGTGKSSGQPYKVTVRLPHGVRDGDQLVVAARASKPGSPPGDLHIRVELQPHPLFQLDADGTVHCELPVDGFVWIANRAVEVPTLGGPQLLELQRDKLSYRLTGQGFPTERRGPRGDLQITITPVFPQALSADQQILFDQLIATSSGPGARQLDERLRVWNQALRKWKQA